MKKFAVLGTRGVPSRYGGFETFAEELGARLAGAGVDVTVFCEAQRADAPRQYRGMTLAYVRASRLGPLSTIVYDLRCLWRCRRGFDVVYMLGYGAAPFCVLPRFGGAEVWLNVDGVEWARAKWGWAARTWFKAMEWVSTRAPTLIVADAEAIRQHLLERHRPRPPIVVIPYGADLVEQEPDPRLVARFGLEPCGYDLLVARIEPENHVKEVIEGHGASGSRSPLVIVGDHTVQTSYGAAVRALESAGARFLGGIYDKEALRALRYHARLNFHGHSVGGTNPSLLEAMACAGFVVAHDNVFNREVLGDAGLFFKDAGHLVTVIRSAEAFTAEARLEIGRRAQRRVRDTYDWEAISRRYLELLT